MSDIVEGRIQTADFIQQFVRLGKKAKLTIQNDKTGNRFTLRVRKFSEKENDDAANPNPIKMIDIMVGTDNQTDYAFFGSINSNTNVFKVSLKSKIDRDHPRFASTEVFARIWERIAAGQMPNGVSVFHSGRCCRCNRELSDPVSIQSGIGPECRKR